MPPSVACAGGAAHGARPPRGYDGDVPRRVDNPPNPWSSTAVEYLEPPPLAPPEVYEETARSILSENDSPDIPFRWGLNPYRGCQHGCAYCYARPTHQYLGWGAGTDFERRLVAKVNAPELLARAFERPGWRGERIAISGVTDPYQPLEATYELTRRCLEVCLSYRNPVVIVTKGALVMRDAALLAELARVADVRVYLSIAFADERVARALEPDASPLRRRLDALCALARAGVPTGVSVSPLIPGLNDADVAPVLARAAEAGARHAFCVLLRLPAEVEDVFLARLAQALPERARRVQAAIRELRGGRLNESRFGRRTRGIGPRWAALEDLFALQCRRLGLDAERHAPARTTFRRPGELFA